MADTIERIANKHGCGWCMTGDHEHCNIETTPWHGKVWVCGCECDKSKVKKPTVHTVNVPAPARKAAKPDPEVAAPSKQQRRKNAKVASAAQTVLDEIMASDEVQTELAKFDA
jgi:hypothetical protein